MHSLRKSVVTWWLALGAVAYVTLFAGSHVHFQHGTFDYRHDLHASHGHTHASDQSQYNDGSDSHGSTSSCAICLAAVLASNGVPAAPPALKFSWREVTIPLGPRAERAISATVPRPFEARGPPLA